MKRLKYLLILLLVTAVAMTGCGKSTTTQQPGVSESKVTTNGDSQPVSTTTPPPDSLAPTTSKILPLVAQGIIPEQSLKIGDPGNKVLEEFGNPEEQGTFEGSYYLCTKT